MRLSVTFTPPEPETYQAPKAGFPANGGCTQSRGPAPSGMCGGRCWRACGFIFFFMDSGALVVATVHFAKNRHILSSSSSR